MKIKLTIIATLLSLGATIVNAQTAKDAFIISQEYNGGSARFKGLGNANTALGGDISSISGNPAGLGFFGQSDISITGSFLSSKNNTTYFGESNSKTKNNFGIDNAGVVFNFPTYRTNGNLDKGWINFNIGASFDKVNNYSSNLYYSGMNNTSTIVQSYTDLMFDYPEWNSVFRNSNLVDPYENISEGYFPLTESDFGKQHVNQLIESGYKSRSNLSFGANHSNKFYIGLGIGFTTFQYDVTKEFTEEGLTRLAEDVVKLNPNSDYAKIDNAKNIYLDKEYILFDDYSLQSRGSGIDVKLGFIYKPSEDWNLGLTIQSPTWMNVSDDYYEKKEASWYIDENATEAFSTFLDENPIYSEYKIQTPFKFSLGASKFFNKGLITAEAEYVDYSSTKVTFLGAGTSNNEKVLNENIKDIYNRVINAKIGGEILINPILSGRAGINYFGNPYKDVYQTQWNGSLGLGVKLTNSVYLDFAVIHSITNYNDSPYLLNDVWGASNRPGADVKLNRTNAVLTLGAKF